MYLRSTEPNSRAISRAAPGHAGDRLPCRRRIEASPQEHAGLRALFDVKLGADPIFEVHPAGGSALCHVDGDERSPVVRRDGRSHVLVGIYVGSVTQSFTDCRRGTQFLNGYESMFGYGDFLRGAIAQTR
jgi:hypothetical protein